MLSIDLFCPDIITPNDYANLESWVNSFQEELEGYEELNEWMIKDAFNRAWRYLLESYLHTSVVSSNWSFDLKIESNKYWHWISFFIKMAEQTVHPTQIVTWIDVARCKITITNKRGEKKLNFVDYLEV